MRDVIETVWQWALAPVRDAGPVVPSIRDGTWTGGPRALSVAMLALALAAATTAGARGAEAYRLQPGDVIEMTVAGVPGMNLRANVQVDGSLDFPAVGALQAEGETISDLRERVQSELASRLLRLYAPDGTEVTYVVQRSQVALSVAEYRPIFVTGDVARPGELAFRPGMTVRQAFAAAGGLPAPTAVAPGIDAEELRAAGVSAWYQAATTEVRAWRLQTELGEAADLDRAALSRPPGSEERLNEIVRLENELGNARALDHERERNFLTQTLSQVDRQLDILKRELDVEKKTEAVDAADLTTAMEMSKKGLYTQSRMSDLRTAALVTSTRRLQTESNLMQLQRRRTEVGRDIERLDDDRRVGLLSELQRARVDLAAARARLQSIDAQLRLAGLAPVGAPADAGRPEFSIARRGGATAVAVDYDTELQPGDVVEVLRSDDTIARGDRARASAGGQAGPIAAALR
jgi:polysaccharide export outer membrane protein